MRHRDGDRVVLTDDSVDKSQPRLEATGGSADGNTITIAFCDGTNLKSRDSEHMGPAWFQFLSRDEYKCEGTWYECEGTWYERGKERRMEECTLRRVSLVCDRRRKLRMAEGLVGFRPLV
jgi:hypothetical protein